MRDTRAGPSFFARAPAWLPAGRTFRAAAAPCLFSIVLLGGAVRLYHVGVLSLWVDEGLTVLAARLPWATVLGFGQTYSVHPPLYFALVKLASVVAPENTAGRLVSVVVGTLTVPVLYALAVRLAGVSAGLLAALVLAVSPLHIWYSQEARPYALVVALVALAYLALTIVVQGGRKRWSVVYAAAVVLALYTDESALFALAPQAPLLAILARGRPRQARLLGEAGIFAVLAYLPWAPHLLATAGLTSTQTQFALSDNKIFSSLRSIAGLSADQAVFTPGLLPPWLQWPGADLFLALGAAIPTLVGGAVLARRAPSVLLTIVCLIAGTIAVCTVVSLVYPSYVERTVLAAVLGWSLLIAIPATLRGALLPRWLARLNLASVLVLSTLTLVALDTSAYKQEWNVLAADASAASRLGLPVVTYPTVAGVLVDLYQPSIAAGRHLALDDADPSLRGLLRGRTPPRALWLAYIAGGGETALVAQLGSAGYVRTIHTYYPYPLYLDLYVHGGLPLGHDVSVAPAPATLASWRLTPRAKVHAAAGGTALVTVNAEEAGERVASIDVPAQTNVLYSLTIKAKTRLASGARAFLECLSPSQAFEKIAPDAGGATLPDDDQDHDLLVDVLCPVGTQALRVDLRIDGAGSATIQVGLHALVAAS